MRYIDKVPVFRLIRWVTLYRAAKPHSPVANGENGLNRALYGTSVKFGTLIEQIEPIVLRNKGLLKFGQWLPWKPI